MVRNGFPPPAIFADAYEWTIPAGWVFSATGQQSTGAPVLLTGFNYNSIRVRSSAGTGGTVQVRATDYNCGEMRSRPRLASLPQTLNVTRNIPTLRIASNAPATITCGDRTNYNFRAETTGGQSGGIFTYSWTATNNWSVPNPTAAVPGILPSGNSGSTINLSGTYSRGGATATLVADSRSFQVDRVAKPVFTAPQLEDDTYGLCSATTFTVAPGAERYAWSTSWGATITETTNSVVILPPAGVTGTGTVSVIAQNPSLNCTSSLPTDFPVYYGAPTALINFTLQGERTTFITPGSGFSACPYETLQVTPAVEVEYTSEITTWEWRLSNATAISSTNSRGGFFLTMPAGISEMATVELRVGNRCGWSTVFISTRNCDEGYEPYRVGPLPIPAYPNPADKQLTVPLSEGQTKQKGQVRLYNDKSKLVRHAPAKGATVVFDVQDLPNGLYLLETPSDKEVLRQKIQIQH